MATSTAVLAVKVIGDASSASRALATSAAATTGFAGKMKSAGATMTAAGSKMTRAITLPAALAGAAAIKLGVDFERSMRNVNSIAQLPEPAFQKLNDQVLRMAEDVGVAPKTLAEGLYDLVSSGFSAKESMGVLRVSANAAKAGLTDTATSTKAVAAVLNAYGLNAKQAGDVSDVLFRTVDRGVISFEELAGTIGQTLPMAAKMGVDIKQVGGAIATMTKQGMSGAEANTRLRAVLNGMIKPSTDLEKAYKQLGVTSGEELIKKTGSVQGALQALMGTTDGSSQAAGKLFNNQRALGGALALTGENSKMAAQDLKGMQDASGATARALAEQSKSIGAQWDEMVAKAQVLGIKLGQAIGPPLFKVLTRLFAVISKLAGWFAKLPGPVKEAAAGFALFAVALGPVLSITGRIVGAFGTVVGAVGTSSTAVRGFVAAGGGLDTVRLRAMQIGTAMRTAATAAASFATALARTAATAAVWAAKMVASLVRQAALWVANTAKVIAYGIAEKAVAAGTKIWAAAQWALNAAMTANPIGLVVAAIVALAAAFVIAYQKSETFRNIVNAVWSGIKAGAQVAASFLKQVWSVVWTALKAYVQVYVAAFKLGFTVIKTVAQTVANILKTVWQVVWTVLKAAVRGYIAVFRAVFNAVKTVARTAANIVKTVWRVVWSVLKVAVNAYRQVFRAAFTVIRTVARTAANVVKTVFRTAFAVMKGILNVFKAAFRGAFNILKSIVKTVVSVFKGDWRGAFSAMRGVVQSFRDTVKNVWNAIKSAIQPVLNMLKGPLKAAFNAVKTAASAVKNAVVKGFNAVKGAIQPVIDMVGKLADAISSLPSPSSVIGKLPNPFSAPAPRAAGYTATSPVATQALRAGGPVGRTAGAGAPVVINVNGALDPDAVARQIERLLAGRTRRVGGVRGATGVL